MPLNSMLIAAILADAILPIFNAPALFEVTSCDNDGNCAEGYSCHPTENICYEDPTPVDRPHFWLGIGPDECNRAPSDCELFGEYENDTSHIHGNGDWCDPGGRKIRCVAKPAPVPIDPTPANVLKVVTYNLYERPFVVSMDGQRERTCRIPRWIANNIGDVDVIALQEVFLGGCWPEPHNASLRTLLTHHGFPYFTDMVDSFWYPVPGGMFIASRWPIVEQDQMVFSVALWNSADYLAAKGVSYAKIVKSVGGISQTYHVMNTHLQSGILDEEARVIRAQQSHAWGQYVLQKNIPANESVIFAADFNERHDAANLITIMGNLNATMPERNDTVEGTTHPGVNDILKMARPGGEPHYIDYVVYSAAHLQPTRATMETLFPREPAFPVCWCERCVSVIREYTFPRPDTCERIEIIRDLSDHLAVMSTFEF